MSKIILRSMSFSRLTQSIALTLSLSSINCREPFDELQSSRLQTIINEAERDLNDRSLTCTEKAKLTKEYLSRINSVLGIIIDDHNERYISDQQASDTIYETSLAATQLIGYFSRKCETGLTNQNPNLRDLSPDCQIPRVANLQTYQALQQIPPDVVFSQNILDSETGFCTLSERSKQVVINSLRLHYEKFTQSQLTRAEQLGLL